MLVGAVAFSSWWAAAHLGFRLIGRTRPGDRADMLLLRVFALGSRSERFFAGLQRVWLRQGRIAMIAASRELPIDAAITLDGERAGSVLDSGWSYTRDEALGVALLDVAVSHAGLAGFACGDIAVRTISSPAVNNRSLYVDPQRHSWATRDKVDFPPLVRSA